MRRTTFFFCLLLATGLAAQTNPGADAVFRLDEVAAIYLEMSPEDKAFFMDPANSGSNEFKSATVRFTNSQLDEQASNAGIRFRGNTSRGHVKKGYKIDFREFGSDKFQSYKKFNLKANVNDPSAFREQLSLRIFREMNIPAARTHLTRLYMNGEYMGIYTNVEQIDDEFLEDRWGHSDGFLYKCHWGASLEDKNQVYNEVVFESKINEEQDTRAELAHFVDVVSKPSSHFQTEIEKVFEVDTYLRYLAVEALIGHWDGYSYNQNNFYLFYNGQTDKVTFIPYDVDNTWGIDWVGGDWGTRDLNEWAMEGNSRPLTQRILNVPAYEERYRYYLSVLLENYFNDDYLEPLLDQAEELLTSPVEDDTYFPIAFGFSTQHFHEAFHDGTINHVRYGLRRYAEVRRETAMQQVEFPAPLALSRPNATRVYPNPSVEPYAYVRSATAPAEVVVYSITGQQVSVMIRRVNAETMQLSLPHTSPKGTYLITGPDIRQKWVYQAP